MPMLPGLPHADTIGNVRHPFHGLITAISMTVQPLLRKEFGIRYLKITDVIGAYIVARCYEMFSHWFGLAASASHWDLFPWFTYSFTALGILHLVRIMLRERAKQQGRGQAPVHTRFHGTSWLSYIPHLERWGFNQRRRLRFLEPALVLATGLLLRPFDAVTGTWLVIAAVALFIKNNMVIQSWIGRQRDLEDARIESQQIMTATTRQQTVAPQGHVVRPPRAINPFLEEEDDGIADTVRNVMGGVAAHQLGHAVQEELGDMLWDGIGDVLDGDDNGH